MTADFTPIYDFFKLPPDQLLWSIMINFGGLPIALTFLIGGWTLWVFYRQSLYAQTLKYVLLAIDIPRNNEVSMRSVENLFTYLGGAHEEPDLIETYWKGMY